MNEVKLRISAVLEEKGKSIKWLSDELGITYANTNNIVNNKTKPSLDRLSDIADKLECSILDLFEKQPTKSDNEFRCPNCGEAIKVIKNELDTY